MLQIFNLSARPPMSRAILLARFIVCCCVLAGLAHAQTLRGIVVDSQGAAIAGAEVTARNSAKVQHSVSGPDGHFSFSQITPPADVSAAKAGFAAGAVKWTAADDLRIVLPPA